MNTANTETENNHEVLVVASKLKNYIRTRAGMNTSSAVPEVLSHRIRQLCDEAIENAKKDGRKTVMDRDFMEPTSS
jgi:histone H3/H4